MFDNADDAEMLEYDKLIELIAPVELIKQDTTYVTEHEQSRPVSKKLNSTHN